LRVEKVVVGLRARKALRGVVETWRPWIRQDFLGGYSEKLLRRRNKRNCNCRKM
jgi:hypothetical protein